jgi:hypothetical protein
MFGIGHWEILCIGVAVLIIFGTALAVAVVLVSHRGSDGAPKP